MELYKDAYRDLYGNEYRIPLDQHLAASQIKNFRNLREQVKLNVLTCAYWENRKPWFVTRRTLADSICLFVRRGKLLLELDDKQHILKRGDCFFLPEKTPHAFGLPSGTDSVAHVIIHCFAHDFFGNEVFPCLDSPVQRLKNFRFYFDHLMTGVALSDAGHGCKYISNIFENILADFALAGKIKFPRHAVSDTRIMKSIRFATDNFASNIGVPDMAEAAGLKEVRFRSLFRSNCGITPSEYLLNVRMNNAFKRLSDRQRPLEEIARECGFGSESYFCYAFRKYTNQTPGEYRRHLFC